MTSTRARSAGGQSHFKRQERRQARGSFCPCFPHPHDLYPDDFKPRWDEVARVTGSTHFKDMIERGQSAETITVQIHDAARKFEEARRPYLLYSEDKAQSNLNRISYQLILERRSRAV